MREFGNPNNELCGAFRTVVQLKMSLILHGREAFLFSINISFSIVCRNAAAKPMDAPIMRTRYRLLSVFMTEVRLRLQ